MLAAIACVAMSGCTKPKEDNVIFGNAEKEQVHQGPFGSCCKDLADCMKQPNALIKTQEDGSLFLTIGYIQTKQGTGWFDHAIIYCPFCGKKLQARERLADKVKDK